MFTELTPMSLLIVHSVRLVSHHEKILNFRDLKYIMRKYSILGISSTFRSKLLLFSFSDTFMHTRTHVKIWFRYSEYSYVGGCYYLNM